MSGDRGQLFPTITGAHWRESIARGRVRRSRLLMQLRLATQLSAAAMDTGAKPAGLRNTPGQSAPDRVLSPATPKPNTNREVMLRPDAEDTSVAGGFTHALRAPNGDACPSQSDVGTAGPSCSVSRATAGRDRRNLWESAPVHGQVGGVKTQPCGRETGAGAPANF